MAKKTETRRLRDEQIRKNEEFESMIKNFFENESKNPTENIFKRNKSMDAHRMIINEELL